MKTFFKTALVAAAIATACGSAHAGNTVVNTQTYSLEGVSSITTAQTSDVITYVTKAAYAVGDKVTFAFTAGAIDNANFPAQLNVQSDETPNEEKAGMALGLLNSTADSVTYRVTSLTQPDTFTDKTTLGQTITLGTVKLKAAAVAAGDISVTVSAETGTGDALDSGSDIGQSRTAKLSQVKTQFGTISVTTDFDGVIDVAEDRTEFVNGSDDSVSFAISEIDTTNWVTTSVVPVEKTTITLNADLAGFDLEEGIGEVLTSSTAQDVKYDDTTKQVTIVYGSEVTTGSILIVPPTGADALVLEAQDFSIAGTYTHSTDEVVSVGSDTAGSWTLNGAVVNIPYMPYGATVDQIMYVTNTGSLSGDVTVTAFDEAGTTYNLGKVAEAEAGTITKLTGPIKDALEAEGFTSGKLSITVTVNAQDKNITVYSAYKVGSDRGNVVNSQYKAKEINLPN